MGTNASATPPGKPQDPRPSGDPAEASAKRTHNLKRLNRLGKYALLLILALITLRLVFDCYSFYIARREIDAELQSKKGASLEYLNLLSQRERGLALSTLEARCLERAQLTLFRIVEVENDAIQKAYGALMAQKRAMVKALDESGLDPSKVEKVIDYINGTGFELFKLDDQLKDLDDGRSPEGFKKLKESLEEQRKQYIATALTHAPLRERIEQIMRAYQAYGELIAQKNALVKILNESGLNAVEVRKVTDYIDASGFELSQLDEKLKILGDHTGNGDAFNKLKAALDEQRNRHIEVARKYAPLRERIEPLFGTYPPTSPSFWTMDAIKVVVDRIDQMREERKANRARFGTDFDEVRARYAVWTDALTRGAAGNPVLDEMAYQMGSDDARLLRDARCDRFKEYYAAVNDRLVGDSKPILGPYHQYLLTYFNQPPATQTLTVTLLLGALGAITLNALRMSNVGWWSNHPDPLWGEIVVGPLLGALAAFGIFLIGSAGLLLTSDTRGAQPLSTYFIGLLGFVSGLLYDEAFGRVRRVGSQIFAGTSDVHIATARAEDRTLAEALKGASASRAASLVLKYGIGTRLGMETEFTLLVPSDEAMGGLTLADWNRLNEEPTAFERWYRHHVVGKRVSRADVASLEAKELRTTDDTVLALETKDDALIIGGIRVVVPDVKWGKGVVHVLQRELG